MKEEYIFLSFEQAKEKIAEGLIREKVFSNALKKNKILFNYGSTNAVILNKLGVGYDSEKYTAGKVKQARFDVTPVDIREKLVLLEKGKPVQVDFKETVDSMGPGDIFLKGGNILFSDNAIGVYIGSDTGGTISEIGAMIGKGVDIISPISISKYTYLISSHRPKAGNNPGLYIMKNNFIFTEINAFENEGYESQYLGINGISGDYYLVFRIKGK